MRYVSTRNLKCLGVGVVVISAAMDGTDVSFSRFAPMAAQSTRRNKLKARGVKGVKKVIDHIAVRH